MITEVIKQGGSYDLNFTITNNSDNVSIDSRATVTVDPNLTLNSIIGKDKDDVTIGAQGAANEWVIGNMLAGAQVIITVNVTIDTMSSELPITLVATSANNDNDVSDNTQEKDLIEELKGVLCSDIIECVIPVGTTAERPVTPTGGTVRFNTDTSKLEVYDGTVWADLH